jgi:hypothetical protein
MKVASIAKRGQLTMLGVHGGTASAMMMPTPLQRQAANMHDARTRLFAL